MLKFHDDPMVNDFEIIIFLRQVRWSAEKKKDFERRRGKMKMKEKRGTVNVKTNLRLFIDRFTLFIYLLFYKNKFYFILYQTNK